MTAETDLAGSPSRSPSSTSRSAAAGWLSTRSGRDDGVGVEVRVVESADLGFHQDIETADQNAHTRAGVELSHQRGGDIEMVPAVREDHEAREGPRGRHDDHV